MVALTSSVCSVVCMVLPNSMNVRYFRLSWGILAVSSKKTQNKQAIYNEVLKKVQNRSEPSTSVIEPVFSPTYARDKTYLTHHCILSCVH